MSAKLTQGEHRFLSAMEQGRVVNEWDGATRILRSLYRKGMIARQNVNNRVRLVLTDAGRQALEGNDG